MLARGKKYRHPLGVTLETPLLVPSFSSKGFGFDKEGRSEVAEVLTVAKEFLTGPVLISAYDIFYDHFPEFEALQSVPEIMFLDSGGYETADEHDLTAVYTNPWPVEKWNETRLRCVLDMWPEDLPSVIVSFDHGAKRRRIEEQIQSAREFFGHYPNQLHDFIIKPETSSQQYVQMTKSVIPNIEELSSFDIIGFTEKELGNSVLTRMVNIAKVRIALNNVKLEIPIHVFGSLDPLASCLYFLAGAEIFDGLTWIRYSYQYGLAIYRQNYGILSVGIREKEDSVRAKAIVDNIYAIRKLQFSMKDFLPNENFQKFSDHDKVLSDFYDTLCNEPGGRQ
ncbi:MAG: hypothetical protein ACLQVJ_28475 [Syntrophobacteraceae bacterium]